MPASGGHEALHGGLGRPQPCPFLPSGLGPLSAQLLRRLQPSGKRKYRRGEQVKSTPAPPPVNWEQIAAYTIDVRSRDVAGASFACPQAALLALLRASIATFGQPTGQVRFARRIDSGRDE